MVAKKGNDVKPTTTTTTRGTGAKAVATAAAPAPVPVPITATTQRQQRQQLRQRPRQRQRQLCPQVRGSAPAPFLASSKYPAYKENEQHTRMYNTNYIYRDNQKQLQGMQESHTLKCFNALQWRGDANGLLFCSRRFVANSSKGCAIECGGTGRRKEVFSKWVLLQQLLCDDFLYTCSI